MEFRLNIYNGKEVEKTYIANDFMLTTGTAEDMLKLVDIDKLAGGLNDEGAILEVVKIVAKAFNSFNPLMKEIFEGLTDDEYRRTHIVEVGKVVLDVLKYTFAELFSATTSVKN